MFRLRLIRFNDRLVSSYEPSTSRPFARGIPHRGPVGMERGRLPCEGMRPHGDARSEAGGRRAAGAGGRSLRHRAAPTGRGGRR